MDRLCAAYLTALDGDDWPTLAGLWRRAEDDPALEHAFHKVNQCLLLDEAVAPIGTQDSRPRCAWSGDTCRRVGRPPLRRPR